MDAVRRVETGDRPTLLWREALGAFLRGTRLEQERILADVARGAGVSVQYLSEIERGRKEPSSEILAAVAGALGLTLVDVAAGVAGQLVGQPVRMPRPVAVLDLTDARSQRTVAPWHETSVPVTPSAGARGVALAA
ncbi:helix-turn-helix domain-containing protein [Agromyces sp. CFH 90414]|uniref:Helix-turn-helix domain-containing protein n=1 Tax=Agromyces agglutinans TaxID=2662258 RepID=A0A6I2F5B9_9MICO|nr:helix-turn-helix transcriptional regulator [Agromyces agglutinans]MRG59461.1 helix-turn-helix domain-containing protein [Agromyces agglutinans]